MTEHSTGFFATQIEISLYWHLFIFYICFLLQIDMIFCLSCNLEWNTLKTVMKIFGHIEISQHTEK